MENEDYFEIMGDFWVVPADVAQLIRDKCIVSGAPLLRSPSAPKDTLFAIGHPNDFTLYLGDPYADPDLPTWRDYLADKGVDIDDSDSLEKWCQEDMGCSCEEAEFKPNPDEAIDNSLLEDWFGEEYDLYLSPMAQAHRYLAGLPLATQSKAEGTSLGKIGFTEGDRPGSNLTYVTVPDLASLACLQERLNELNESVKIEIMEAK